MPSLDMIEPHWFWLALGLVLAIGEMTIPGVFLIWLAGAAIVTGLAAWVLPIGVPVQVVLFVALALVSVFAGKRYLADNPIEPADPKMNDRGARAVGETVLVTSAIDGGTGRVRLGDSEWLAKGPDAEPGTRMRVSGHDGAVLLVEHLH
ncbi:MAG: NfeD family protein [Novosphingobium sp.]|uniref:NfeD family protein n=1 Tax=Novosphingobium sp. TaxID=1874826 RepID=UPI001DF4DDCF|nr:NfeD family protein [Novosphingobium sp.]MCB2058822.1 NfeD family protein [Novosphingobium sp.]HNN54874.1 NfeD family protein [Novosphingobium sp.]